MDNKKESSSFLHIIADARNIPEGIDPLAERDAPRRGDPSNSDGLISPPDFDMFDQLGTKVNCLQFSEVLVLWRPWESCSVCRRQIEADPSLVPVEGTYICPHIQDKRYKEVIDHCLSGKGALATKEFFNLKNGTRVVHVEWLEGDPKHREKLRREAENAQKRSIYPPRPDVAFSQDQKK
jgi:hypothetical protein